MWSRPPSTKPNAHRRMRSIAPWRYTTLSHSMNCRLGKLKRGNLLTCHAVLGKNSVGGAKSSMTSSSVRVLDPWCALVSASPNSSERRKRDALWIMSASCFLTCKWCHAFSSKSCPCFKCCKAWRGEGGFPRAHVSNLKVLGRFRTSSTDLLQDITRHTASGLRPQCRLSSKRSASRPSSRGLWARKSLIRRNLFHKPPKPDCTRHRRSEGTKRRNRHCNTFAAGKYLGHTILSMRWNSMGRAPTAMTLEVAPVAMSLKEPAKAC